LLGSHEGDCVEGGSRYFRLGIIVLVIIRLFVPTDWILELNPMMSYGGCQQLCGFFDCWLWRNLRGNIKFPG